MNLVVEKDKKWVLNHLPIALPKREIGLVFWVAVVGDSLRSFILAQKRMKLVLVFFKKKSYYILLCLALKNRKLGLIFYFC